MSGQGFKLSVAVPAQFCSLQFNVSPRICFFVMANLTEVLKQNNVPEPLVEFLTTTCGNTTIEMFLDMVVKADYETELRDMVKAKFPVSEAFTADAQRIFVTKARGAYRIAFEMAAAGKAEAEEAKRTKAPEGDIERELDPETRASLKKTWDASTSWSPDKTMKGAPALRNRCFREFRGQCMTLHMVEKAITVEDVKRPAEKRHVPLGNDIDAGLYMEYHKPMKRVVDTTLAYLSALRLLTGTYSYCGTHLHPSKKDPSREVVFFPFGDGINYCDRIMAKVLCIDMPEREKLAWLRKRDEATRGEMVQLVNDGWPAGEALEEAMTEVKQLWLMKDGTVAAPERDTTWEDEPPRRRSRSAPRKSSQKGGGKSAANKAPGSISIDSKGVKYCGAWNTHKGCVRNEKQCPQKGRHACSAWIQKGVACGRKDHRCCDH